MGLLNLLRRITGREARSGLRNPQQWLIDALTGGSTTASGVNVSEASALKFGAVYAAVRIIGETVASLPFHVYRRKDNGDKERIAKHPAERRLNVEPNPEMTAIVFRETLQAHVLTWGNGYAEISRDTVGRVAALWPIAPDRVSPKRTAAGALEYVVRSAGGGDVTLPANRMLHVPGLSFDGVVGYSPIALARQAIGLGIAAEQFGATFFGEGAKAGGLLEHPGMLKPEARDRLRETWNAMHKGPDKAHRTAILEDGMKWHQITIPPEDAQFLETRKFQITEIARIYRIPPHMLADLERATFSNIEHQAIQFVVHCIRPWLIRWEQECNRKLFKTAGVFCEHVVDGLLRGDIGSRYRAYAIGRQWGWLSVNMILRKENENSIGPAGDIFMVPSNMMPADKFGKEPEPPAPPPAAPPAEGEDGEGEDGEPKPGDDGRNVAVVMMHRDLLRDLWQRIVNREVRSLRRALKPNGPCGAPEELQAFVGDFYADHERHIREVLTPAVRALFAATGRTDSPEAYVAAEAKAYRNAGAKAVLQVLTREGDDRIDTLSALLDEWEISLPERMAEQVLSMETNHAENG